MVYSVANDKGVDLFTLKLSICKTQTFQKPAFVNIVRKGENADNQHFFLFPYCFETTLKTNFMVWVRYCFCCLQTL